MDVGGKVSVFSDPVHFISDLLRNVRTTLYILILPKWSVVIARTSLWELER